MASRYLAANPGGDISGFLREYIAEEEKLLTEKAVVDEEGTSQVVPDPSPQIDANQERPPPPSESTSNPPPPEA